MVFQHIVFLKLDPALPEEKRGPFREALKKANAELAQLPGAVGVVVGRVESQKSSQTVEYTHTLAITFQDKAAFAGYEGSAAHASLRAAIHDFVVEHISLNSVPYE